MYQVKNWSEYFENDRSRSRKNCSFVCIPNKQHGMGFARIMAEPDGAAIFGVWILIVEACSQQTHREGWLSSDGEQTGSAWGARDMALKFRRPEPEIQRALDFLSSEQVGWLGNTQAAENKDLPQTHRVVTAQSPSTPLERREGIEGKERSTPPTAREESQPCREIESVEQVIASTKNQIQPHLIPDEDFTRYVYDDWSTRGGKDGNGQPVEATAYVLKRWKREGTEWRNGTHRAKRQTTAGASQRPLTGAEKRRADYEAGWTNP